MKRSVSSLRDSEIAFAVAEYMYKHAKPHPSAGRLWEGSIGYAISILFQGTLDDDRASMVRSFLRLNKVNSYWENGVFKGWAVPALNPLTNWRNEIRFGGTKVDPASLISPLPIDEVKISCAYCQQSFDGQEAFEAHKNGQVNCKAAATCLFCSKVFDAHHSMTAHVRLHGEQVDRTVLDAITKNPGMSRNELEQVVGFNFSLRTSMTRLCSAGLVYYDKDKKWFKAETELPEVHEPLIQNPQTERKTVSTEMPSGPEAAITKVMEKIESLALADLKKKHAEEYQRILLGIIDKLTTV